MIRLRSNPCPPLPTVDIIRPQGVVIRTKRYCVRVSVRLKGGRHTDAVTFGPTTKSLLSNNVTHFFNRATSLKKSWGFIKT